MTRQAWEAADAPPETDLAAGRPLRPEAWCSLLEQSGYDAVAQLGPGRRRLPRHRGPVRHHLAVRARRAVSAAAGGPVAVHQFIATLNPHDATGTHALKLRDALRAAGWRSEIFAEAIHDDLASEAFKHWMYPEHAAAGDVAIYQFTTSSAVAGYLAEHGLPLILDFHNFTGPEFFAGWEPQSVHAGSGGGRRAGAAGSTGAARVGQEPVQRGGAAAGGLPAHRGRARAGRLRARHRAAGRPGGGRAGPRPGDGWRRHPLRRADRALQGPARARQGAVGVPPPLRREGAPAPGRGHVELRVHQGAAGLRRTTSACPPPCACPARSRTRRWPPTSTPPTSTSRCPRTRGSASRSSRPWWPACPSSPAVPARCPTPWPTPRWCWRRPTRPTLRRPLHRVCTDERLRATLIAAGTPSCGRALRRDGAARIVDAVAAVVGRP